jgi:hypothetical protein
MSFDAAEQIVRGALSAIPGTRWAEPDRRNRIAFIEVADGRLDAVLDALGSRFWIDPDASLKY